MSDRNVVLYHRGPRRIRAPRHRISEHAVRHAHRARRPDRVPLRRMA